MLNETRTRPAAFACCTVNAPSLALIRVPQTAPLGVVMPIRAGNPAGLGGAHHQVPIAATKSRSDPAITNLARRSRADTASAQATSNWRTPPYLATTSVRLSFAGVPAAACNASHSPVMAASSPPSARMVSAIRQPVVTSLAAAGPFRSSPPVARATNAASPVRHFSAAAWVEARLCSLSSCHRARSCRLSAVGPADGLRYLSGAGGACGGPHSGVPLDFDAEVYATPAADVSRASGVLPGAQAGDCQCHVAIVSLGGLSFVPAERPQ